MIEIRGEAMKPSYTHGISDVPLIGKTIGDWLDEIAAELAANEALVSVFENRRFTYAAFLGEVNRCARALMALGAQKGDRVGIWSTNCVAWVIVQFATAKIGAVLVNINPAYRLHELKFALQQSECSELISGAGFKDADYLAMLHQLIPELASVDPRNDLRSKEFPHLRRIILLPETPLTTSLSPSAASRAGDGKRNALPWPELLSLADKTPHGQLAERKAALIFVDLINNQYTS